MRLTGGLGAICATLALLGSIAAPAGASLHPPLGVLAQGKPTPVPPGLIPFGGTCGVGVDSQGRFYVSDYQRALIHVFGPGYLTQFDSSSAGGENAGCELAVDSDGRVYANHYHQGVLRYTPGAYTATALEPGPDPEPTTGVAVDPLTDRVYVAHRTYVSAYEPDGSPVLDGSDPLRIGEGSLGDAYGLAVSGFAATAGHLYVADAAGDVVEAFDPAGDPLSPVLTIEGTETPPGAFRDLTDADLAIDDLNGNLFLTDNLQPGFERPLGAVYEFDLAGAYLGQLPQPIVHGEPSGIAVDNSIDSGSGKRRGTIYATSGNEEGSVVYGFCPVDPGSASLDAACPTPSPSEVLKVARDGSGQGTVSSDPTPIGCGTLCAWEFDSGSQVILFANPGLHSVFTGWSVAGEPAACPGTGVCTLTLSAETEVTATFAAIPRRTLTLSAGGKGTITSKPAGIDCGTTCAGQFDQGRTVTLNPAPDPGWRLAGWQGGGCTGTGPCEVTMSADVEVSASFEPIDPAPPPFGGLAERVLAVSVLGSGAGAITSEPAGIACGMPCAAIFPPGAEVSLIAIPDSESRFAGFSGCDVKSANRCTVSMAEHRTVIALFEEAVPLRVGKARMRGARATLRVAVPSAGTVTASAKGLRRAGASAKGPRTVSLSLTLNKAGRRALRVRGGLRVRVEVAFRPEDGGAVSRAAKTLTFKRGSSR